MIIHKFQRSPLNRNLCSRRFQRYGLFILLILITISTRFIRTTGRLQNKLWHLSGFNLRVNFNRWDRIRLIYLIITNTNRTRRPGFLRNRTSRQTRSKPSNGSPTDSRSP
ncbi:hypothetical protein HanRHA438_Chr01g0007681 [Helianthus annuus]|nr:hypothetical protein HanRHA438_Chr01g0007681 [Helianthus annuus]